MPFSLRDLYKKAIPTNARLYMESLAGKKTPITEEDFSPEELEIIRKLGDAKYVQGPLNRNANFSARVRSGLGYLNTEEDAGPKKPTPQVGYMDYSAAPDLNNWTDAIVKSYSSPKFNIGTSLGNFGIEDEGDSYRAYDTYNWNGDFNRPIKSLSDLWDQTRITRPTELLNGIAELYAPKISRPVNIRVPKKK